MMLLVDIGNTRVKWATCAGRRISPQRAAHYSEWDVADWQRELFGTQRYTRVMVAAVAGADSKHLLSTAAARAGVDDLRFVTSTASAAGVRNAYPDPRLLGVDRWVGVIGAYHLQARACCIADVGTAATIDAVDGSGQHLGGFIVPGPRLMVTSLLTGTSDLAAHSAASRTSDAAQFADNTRDAIEQGCRIALAALIERSCADLARVTGATPTLLLTGGAAAEVQPYLQTPFEHVPDLVLHGLARLAGSQGP
jgi:type III pantothenate kinase